MNTPLLVMDTVGPRLMVGVLADVSGQPTLIADHTETSNDQRHHSATLIPALQALLDAADVQPIDLAGIAVVTGPGSFTGIRTVMAFAQTMAQQLNVPLVPLCSLQVWAMAAIINGIYEAEPCNVAMDARRDRAYVASIDLTTCPLPTINGEVTCQPIADLAINGIYDAPSSPPWLIEPSLVNAFDAINAVYDVVPDVTTPHVLQQWCGRMGVSVAMLIAQTGQPAADVQPIYGQPPNITLPKAR